MPRPTRGAPLALRPARARLAPRREPYWEVVAKGCALGYRKGATGGTWIARRRGDGGSQRYHALGPADDDGDGLSYAEARRRADGWFAAGESGGVGPGPVAAPYTVKDALDDYMAVYRGKDGKSTERTQRTIDALIVPALGSAAVGELSRRWIEGWHEGLSRTAPRLRTKPGKPQKFRAADDGPAAIRRRRSSANRVLTVLKAALNLAHRQRRVASDAAWRGVKPFREAASARVRVLDDDDSRRLVAACAADFRPLVLAALLTGCRYGELAELRAGDFDAESGGIRVGAGRSHPPRQVWLPAEGRTLLAGLAAGKAGDAPVFTRADGAPWGTSHQQRPFKAACAAAGVAPLTFHDLRHTYAARLVAAGVPLAVVAAQLGHTDTRMVERYYGPLAPGCVADTVRAAFASLGLGAAPA